MGLVMEGWFYKVNVRKRNERKKRNPKKGVQANHNLNPTPHTNPKLKT